MIGDSNNKPAGTVRLSKEDTTVQLSGLLDQVNNNGFCKAILQCENTAVRFATTFTRSFTERSLHLVTLKKKGRYLIYVARKERN